MNFTRLLHRSPLTSPFLCSSILRPSAHANISTRSLLAPFIAPNVRRTVLTIPTTQRVGTWTNGLVLKGGSTQPSPFANNSVGKLSSTGVGTSFTGVSVLLPRSFNSTTIARSSTNPIQSGASTLSPSPPLSFVHRYSPPGLLPYLLLARVDKPVGTWLLLLPTWWTVALASSPGSLPDLRLMTIMAVGAFVMRGAGCTINDMWDRNFDRQVVRTKDRPLASGAITMEQGMVFLAAQLSVALGVVMQLDWFT